MQELIPGPFHDNNYCASSTSEEMGWLDEYKGATPAHYRAGNNGQPQLLYLISVIR